MRIINSPPLHGVKSEICRGDEAVVSRMANGLVERLQTSGGIVQSRKFIVSGRGGPAQDLSAGENQPEYHILKFLSLVLGGKAFPGHFPKMEELRLSRDGNLLVAASYSEFVADSTGVIVRRSEAMERYYAHDENLGGDTVREDSDSFERASNPELRGIQYKLARAGLIVNHPEANYHVDDGRTVLFEIDRIDMPRAARAVSGEEQVSLLGEIYAVAFISHLRSLERTRREGWERSLLSGYHEAGLRGLFNFFRHFIREGDSYGQKVLGEGQDIWKFHIQSYLKVMEATRRGRCELDQKELPVPIEPSVLPFRP